MIEEVPVSRSLTDSSRIISLILLLMGSVANARPEFALRIGQNRCTTCHFSPAGGGPKTLTGKYYGSAGFPLSSFSKQDYAGADVKALYYEAEHHGQTQGGAGIMAVNIYASIPLLQDKTEIRLVGEHNLGGFNSGPRNLYVRWQLTPDTENTWAPQYVLLGRFIPPFGVMTDEHRTYVRIQSGTQWNQGFDTGVLLSANPYQNFHYDIGLLNGQKNIGTLAVGEATQWGMLANVRHMPAGAPIMVGASTSYYEALPGNDPASAWSIYGQITGYRISALTRNKFVQRLYPFTLSMEFSSAKNWNSVLAGAFVSNPAFATAVGRDRSSGWLAMLNYDVTPKFSLIYKYDRLALNHRYPSDAYQRHGVGAKYYWGPMIWSQLRIEMAEAGAPAERKGNKMGALDAVWAVMSIGI